MFLEAFRSKTTWHDETPRHGGREAYEVTYRVGMDRTKTIKVFVTRDQNAAKTKKRAIEAAKKKARVGRSRFSVVKVSGPGLNESVSLYDLVMEQIHKADRLARPGEVSRARRDAKQSWSRKANLARQLRKPGPTKPADRRAAAQKRASSSSLPTPTMTKKKPKAKQRPSSFADLHDRSLSSYRP